MERDLDTLATRFEKLRSLLQLAATVSHEMTQPLTGISGYCALVKEQLHEEDPIYKDILQIERQARRLEQLVNKFQNVALLEISDLSDKSDASRHSKIKADGTD